MFCRLLQIYKLIFNRQRFFLSVRFSIRLLTFGSESYLDAYFVVGTGGIE